MGFWVGFWVGLRARDFPTERVLSRTPLITRTRTVDQKTAKKEKRKIPEKLRSKSATSNLRPSSILLVLLLVLVLVLPLLILIKVKPYAHARQVKAEFN